MDYSANRGRDTLPEFQKFLIDRKLVPEAKVSFFVHWVSRFLDYTMKQGIAVTEYQESVVAAFLDWLRSDARIQDWQPDRAAAGSGLVSCIWGSFSALPFVSVGIIKLRNVLLP
ncbi:MAG: hypothetical protein Q7U68_07845 [Candidatus Roizmanbacteria bacterium]|nr:hypothetical protein [Candidatus Roizmanbacteria bacterium]